MKKQLTIGDEVKWRGCFGNDRAKKAKVVGIEITNGGKYGDDVISVDWSKVTDRNVVVDVETADGVCNWAYADQIKQIK